MNMFRRNFIQRITLAGAAGVVKGASGKVVIYHVKGFSCPTCAVGLDTMLHGQKGVLRSKSTYPEGKVTIEFDPDLVGEASLRGFIAEQGFTVESSTT